MTFTELHALTIGDIDGDGIPDIITGKRHWAHLDSYTDADGQGAPVLYGIARPATRRRPAARNSCPS